MKVYTTDKIRNIVLLGHGGAGKISFFWVTAVQERQLWQRLCAIWQA